MTPNALRVLPLLTLLAGVVLALLPGAGRPDVRFGVILGEALARGEAARRIGFGYRLGVAAATIGGLLGHALLASVRHPLAQSGPFVVVVLLGWTLYVRAWGRMRALAGVPTANAATPAGDNAAAPGAVPAIAWIAVAAAVLGGLFALAYAWRRYDDLPALVPAHFGRAGFADRWVPKDHGTVFALPATALVLGTMVSLMSVLVARARPGRGMPSSPEALRRFRRALATWLAGVSLLTTALLVSLSYQMLGVGLGRRDRLSPAMLVFVGLLVAYAIGGAVVVAVRQRAGPASPAEGAPPAAPDRGRWVLGVFYVDRADPAVVVERRLGVGCTPNFGNPVALVLFGGLGLLLLGVAVLASLAR